MPLTKDDCGYLSDVINENINGLWANESEEDKEDWLSLAKRFRESYETGLIED